MRFGRGARPGSETLLDLCFYCDKPIGDMERVKGKFADAHRTCVHAVLIKCAGENWLERHCDNRTGRRKAKSVGKRRFGKIVEVSRNFIWVQGTCDRIYQLNADRWPPGDPPEVGMAVSFVPHWVSGHLHALEPRQMESV